MTPESIAGLTIPAEQLQDLLDALSEPHEDNVVSLHSATATEKAA